MLRAIRWLVGASAFAGALIIVVDVAAAQQPATRTDVRANQQTKLRTSRAIETAPDASSPYALPVPELTLQTTKEGTQATAVIGVSNPFWGFRTTFKTPIGKEADAEATPLSLAGLANQASVDFAVLRRRVFRDSTDIDNLRLAFCKERGIPNNKCSDQAVGGAERAKFLDYGIYSHPTFYTAHVQIGGKSFDFVETGQAAQVTEHFTSLAGGASYGWLFLESQSLVAVSVDGARDYAASKDSTLLCQPIATNVPGTQRCDTRVIGRPTPSRKVTTTIDYRKVFTRIEPVPATPGKDGKPATPSPIPEQSKPVVGLSLQFRVQAIENAKTIWGIDAPVYFLQKKPDDNKSIALNGGASAGWDSKNGFSARVFIGTAFSLLGGDFSQ